MSYLFFQDNANSVTVGLNPPDSRVGSNIPTYQFWTQLLADMKTLNMTWLRFQLSWKFIQIGQNDDPSTWLWTPIDNAVSNCNIAGVNITFVVRGGLSGAPTWALVTDGSNRQMMTDEGNLSSFAQDPILTAKFAQQVAKRYNGLNTPNPNAPGFNLTLQSIEIGNEEFNQLDTNPKNFTLVGNVQNGTSYPTITVKQVDPKPLFGETYMLSKITGGGDQVVVTAVNPDTVGGGGGGTNVWRLTVTDTNGHTFTATQNAPDGTSTNQVIHAIHNPRDVTGSNTYSGYEYYSTTYHGLVVTPNPVTQPKRDPYFFANVFYPCLVGQYAISAVNPYILIGAAAIWWHSSPNTYDFIYGYYNRLKLLGLAKPGQYFDYVNIHFYSNTNDPAQDGNGTEYPPSTHQAVYQITKALTDVGDPDKPIWITEFGWGSNNNNNPTGPSKIDCDVNTQLIRYVGTASRGQNYCTANATIDTTHVPYFQNDPTYHGKSPQLTAGKDYTQGADYFLETTRKARLVEKVSIFTLDYHFGSTNGQQTITSSLVQFDPNGSGTRTELPAYAGVKWYNQQFLWGVRFQQTVGNPPGGGGGGGGGGITIVFHNLFYRLILALPGGAYRNRGMPTRLHMSGVGDQDLSGRLVYAPTGGAYRNRSIPTRLILNHQIVESTTPQYSPSYFTGGGVRPHNPPKVGTLAVTGRHPVTIDPTKGDANLSQARHSASFATLPHSHAPHRGSLTTTTTTSTTTPLDTTTSSSSTSSSFSPFPQLFPPSSLSSNALQPWTLSGTFPPIRTVEQQHLFGIGTYQSIGGTGGILYQILYPTGIPSAQYSLQRQSPYAGAYGGSYGYVLDTTVRAPKRLDYTPAIEIGLDNLGNSIIRGFPQMVWIYDTVQPDHWYYLWNLYVLSAKAPPGFQYIVLIQYPKPDGSNEQVQTLARWDPPTHGGRDVGSYQNVTLTFRYLGEGVLPAGTFVLII